MIFSIMNQNLSDSPAYLSRARSELAQAPVEAAAAFPKLLARYRAAPYEELRQTNARLHWCGTRVH